MLKLFNTKLTPQKNAIVEDIDIYLNSCRSLSISNINYIKHDLDITVKVNLEQRNLDALGYNYALIWNDGDPRTYYYFIMSAKWKSSNTIELNLSMDTLNTFYKDLEWTDRTVISRQHKDRFMSVENPQVLRRIVDTTAEGVEVVKELSSDIAIYDTNEGTNFYLIYRTRKNLSKDDLANPVDCFLVSDGEMTVRPAGEYYSPKTIRRKDLDTKTAYYMDPINNPGATWSVKLEESQADYRTYTLEDNQILMVDDGDGTQDGKVSFTILTYRNDNGLFTFAEKTQRLWVASMKFTQSQFFTTAPKNSSPVYDKSFPTGWTDIVNLKTRYFVPSGRSLPLKTIPFGALDRTDSRLMKIIKLPYAPVEYTVEDGVYKFGNNWEYDNSGMLRLKNLTVQFKRRLAGVFDLSFMNISRPKGEFHNVRKDIKYESKLFNSSFFEDRLTYDRDSIFNLPEQFKGEGDIPNILPINFYATNTLNSNLMFELDRSGAPYKHLNDYDDYLTNGRNNEMTVFSNQYVDYIRNGYNYDKETATAQQKQRYISMGLGIAGTVIAGAVSVATGNIISGAAAVSQGMNVINSIAGNIQAQQNAERDIQHKLDNYAVQATGYRGSNDIDLFEIRTENKVHHITYEPLPRMRELLFDLFYYCGYAENKQDIPNLNSRYWFNYIQCQPVFATSQSFVFDNYLDDIKARFNAGATVFHNHGNVWDLDQEKENWETWI